MERKKYKRKKSGMRRKWDTKKNREEKKGEERVRCMREKYVQHEKRITKQTI